MKWLERMFRRRPVPTSSGWCRVIVFFVALHSLGAGHVLSHDLDEIIRRHIKAQGKDRMAEFSTFRLRTSCRTVSNTGSFKEALFEARFPSEAMVNYDRHESIEFCFDGGDSWIGGKTEDGVDYIHTVDMVMFEDMMESVEIYPIAASRKAGRARLLGVSKIGTSDAFEIEVVRSSGNTDLFYVDVGSYLVVKVVSLRRRNGETKAMTRRYYEFEPMSRVMISRKIVSGQNEESVCDVVEVEFDKRLALEQRCLRPAIWHVVHAAVSAEKTVVPSAISVKGGMLDDKSDVALLFAPERSSSDPTWIYRSSLRPRGSKTDGARGAQIAGGKKIGISFRGVFERSFERLARSLFPRLTVISDPGEMSRFDLVLLADYAGRVSWIATPSISGIDSLGLSIAVELVNSDGISLGTTKTLFIEEPKKKNHWSALSRTQYLANAVFEKSMRDIAVELERSPHIQGHLQQLAEQRERPPGLTMTARFDDVEGILPNGRLDAGERASVRVDVRNEGEGVAFEVMPRIAEVAGIQTPRALASFKLAPGAEKSVMIPITAGIALSEGICSLQIDLDEKRGYGARPLLIEIPCSRLRQPQLEIIDIALVDKGARVLGNGDGRPSNGEILEAVVSVKNSGDGHAAGVEVIMSSKLPIEIQDRRVVLESVAPNQLREARLLFSIPRAFDAGELDLEFSAVEARGEEVAQATKAKTWPIRRFQADIGITYQIYDGNSAKSIGNRDGTLNNGEIAEVAMIVHNSGKLTARDVKILIEPEIPGIEVQPSNMSIGDLPHDGRAPEQSFLITVSRRLDQAPRIESVRLGVTIQQGDFSPQEQVFTLPFRAVFPDLRVNVSLPERMVPNAQGEIAIEVYNEGNLEAQGVELSVTSGVSGLQLYNNRDLPREEVSVSVGSIAPSVRSRKYRVAIRSMSDLAPGEIPILVSIRQKDYPGVMTESYSLMSTAASPGVVPVNVDALAPLPEVAPVQTVVAPATISFARSKGDDPVFDKKIAIQFEVQYPTTLEDVRLSHNRDNVELGPRSRGRLEAGSRGGNLLPQSRWRIESFEPTVELVPGENLFEVVAVTPGGRSSRTLPITLAYEEAKIWLVAIGIDQYRDSEINDLRLASSDATAVFEYYRDNMGVPKDQMILLINEKATLRGIRSALGTRLPSYAKNYRDTVIIYLAGHGYKEADPSGANVDGLAKYFLPFDADLKDLFSTALDMGDLAGIIRRIRAERVVVVIDSCFSGATAGARTIFDPDQRARGLISEAFLDQIATSGDGRVVFTASGANEVSLEREELGHGVFTWSFLEALRGAADSNRDEMISVFEVYNYVVEKVRALTDKGQNPELKAPNLTGDIVIGRTSQKANKNH